MFEINGSSASVRWDADAPNELWLGYRDKANEVLAKDLAPGVQAYTHLPGGPAEVWPDALRAIRDGSYR
jgi:hypothetical protein